MRQVGHHAVALPQDIFKTARLELVLRGTV
jgi:hypothetical protein